jgi:hypothetical protein
VAPQQSGKRARGAEAQDPDCDVRRSAELFERDAKEERSEEPGAKADSGIEPNRCPSQPRGSNGEHARSEIGKVSLHDEADHHGQCERGDVNRRSVKSAGAAFSGHLTLSVRGRRHGSAPAGFTEGFEPRQNRRG